MRINKFVAQSSGLSRRAADEAIRAERVTINGQPAELGDDVPMPVPDNVFIRLDDQLLKLESQKILIMLNKPVGYVCSRFGQGSDTVYKLLPDEYHSLQTVGRLDKDSSGLLLLTNDGDFTNQLTHPRYEKLKVYEVTLDTALQPLHQQMIHDHGIQLDDGLSKLQLEKLESATQWRVSMREGRNRQIRRTFAALGYEVTKLQRIRFGAYEIADLAVGEYRLLDLAADQP